MDNETVTIEAAKVYAEVLRYGDPATIRIALRQADHEGWMRGWEERDVRAWAFVDSYAPLVFMAGWALGALLIVVLLVR